MIRHVAIAVALCVVVTSIGRAQGPGPNLLGYTVDNLVDLYVQLALSREAGTDTEGTGILTKWPPEAAIRIFAQPSETLIERDGPELFINETKRISDFIASPISHPKIVTYDAVQLAEVARQARLDGSAKYFENSVSVYIATRKELLEKMLEIQRLVTPLFPDYLIAAVSNAKKTACVGWNARRGDADWNLYRAFVFIEYKDKPTLDSCLYEEVMQSFGIPDDFPPGTPSIFNDDDVYHEPTELDLLLWRVHADPRLRAGMKEEEVRPIARQIIEELLAGK